ncbi:hypothetical protein Pelo_12602 [Pelomyxa schiedti]|nr:hypothetical protein Pelo_12602 [Pelomyxa schiedti]
MDVDNVQRVVVDRSNASGGGPLDLPHASSGSRHVHHHHHRHRHAHGQDQGESPPPPPCALSGLMALSMAAQMGKQPSHAAFVPPKMGSFGLPTALEQVGEEDDGDDDDDMSPGLPGFAELVKNIGPSSSETPVAESPLREEMHIKQAQLQQRQLLALLQQQQQQIQQQHLVQLQLQQQLAMQHQEQMRIQMQIHQRQMQVEQEEKQRLERLRQQRIQQELEQQQQLLQQQEQASPIMYTAKAKRRPPNMDKSKLYCHQCGKRETPEWRKGPDGPATLCNACGLQWNTTVKMMACRSVNPATTGPPIRGAPWMQHNQTPQSPATPATPTMSSPLPHRTGPAQVTASTPNSYSLPEQQHTKPSTSTTASTTTPTHASHSLNLGKILTGHGILEAYPDSLISFLHHRS